MTRQGLQHVVVTLAQVGLLGAAIVAFEVEAASGLPAFVPLIFVGYAVHAVLPARARAPAFLLLSVAGAFLHLGWDAPLLLASALGLFGLAHVPGPLALRIGLLVAATAALAGVRVGQVEAGPLLAVIPLLASMFMFRLVLYLREPAVGQASLWTRLGYFLMLPNLLFPLFPIVDWAAWRRAPATPLPELHRRGVQWIARGLVHLLAYRVVYHLLLPAPWAIEDAGSVLQWIFANYALYLRISGQYHVIVGMLLLFDHDLPETHHLYFFSASMNDYWRRVNVYWTAFVEKTVFYPVFLRLRRARAPQALVLAIAVTFTATWALHVWQWFWLRGQVEVVVVDALFWISLGVMLAVNSAWEASRPPASRSTAQRGLLSMLGRAVQTVGFFCLISLAWSMWVSESVGEWTARLAHLGVGAGGWATFAALAAVAIAGGVLLQLLAARPAVVRWGARLAPASSPTLSFASCAAILLLGLAPRWDGEPPAVRKVRDAIAGEHLNEQDLMVRTRGYYENLLPRASLTGELWRATVDMPPSWKKISDPEYTANVGWPIGSQLHPNLDVIFNGAHLTTNVWSMRDRHYEQQKPPRTYRIALLGASYVMGSGVADDEVFESMVEERLNAEFAGGKYDRYEILNFACGGYTLASQAAIYEQRVRAFDVDLVLVGDHDVQAKRLVTSFAASPKLAAQHPNEAVAELVRRLGVEDLEPEEAERRLGPHKVTLTRLLLRQLHDAVKADGAKLAWLYIPLTSEDGIRDEIFDARSELASEPDMIMLSIEDAYGGRPQHELALAPWDDHPDAGAHRLLADALVEELVDHDRELGLALDR